MSGEGHPDVPAFAPASDASVASGDALRNEAIRLVQKGNVQQAEKPAEQALGADEKSGTIANVGDDEKLLGHIYETEGKYLQAAQAYRTSMAISWNLASPENEERPLIAAFGSAYRAAVCYAKDGRPREGDQMYETSRKIGHILEQSPYISDAQKKEIAKALVMMQADYAKYRTKRIVQ